MESLIGKESKRNGEVPGDESESQESIHRMSGPSVNWSPYLEAMPLRSTERSNGPKSP